MPHYHQGSLAAQGFRFAVVVSRFNSLVSERLLEGALDALQRHGVDDGAVDVFWVPGAFEIPLVARRLGAGGKYQAVICLGCVIRGATAHFEYVAGECAAGIARAGAETGVPTILGVLTTENVDQALERAGTQGGNKGFEAALAALEMADLMRQIG